MALTLGQLEALCSIARLGSFERAARQLRVAQPTVSFRIRQLERALGLTLFSRAGRTMRFTAAGTRVLRQAQRLLQLAGEIEARAGSPDPLTGVLRLGVPESFAIVCLPVLLKYLRRRHPRLTAELTVEVSPELLRLLRRGQLDIAIVGNPEGEARLRVQPLGLHGLTWVASPRLGLHGRVVGPADLARYPVLSNPPPAPIIRLVMDWFLAAGVEPLRITSCNSLATMVRLVAAGLGVSVLPPSLFRAERAAGLLRPLRVRPPLPHATMTAVFVGDDDGPALRAAVAAIRHVIARTRFLEPLGAGSGPSRAGTS